MTKPSVVLIALALLGALIYTFAASSHGVVGFPLDDAWIHQVSARNLAQRGEFAFAPGQPSAGSTSPLWTLALAAGYSLQMDFRVWSYLLGAALLGGSAWLALSLARRIWPHSTLSPYFLPLFILFEWHMAWSAVSGMEIPLFILLSLCLLEAWFGERPAWVLGIIAGLLAVTRPEGLVLAGLVGIGLCLPVDTPAGGSERGLHITALIRRLLGYVVGLAVLILPYLALNYRLSGAVLPSTFYAKNAEYAELFQQMPLLLRWLQLELTPWVGGQVLLLPGLVYAVWTLWAKRNWRALIPFAWLLLLPALYALRLPVAYQHGRYEMPIVPFIGLYGIYGTAELLRRIPSHVPRATWAISTVVLIVLFWLLGANAYADDVAIIDCEMVQTAHWVAANAPGRAVVAAHDIGALGYATDRPILDLAGLVSPEVIPFIRDEGRLRDFLLTRGAALAIFFPDWYPTLAADEHLVPIHRSECPITLQAGGTNMVVYEIIR